jgi:hypothetical protein
MWFAGCYVDQREVSCLLLCFCGLARLASLLYLISYQIVKRELVLSKN